MFWKNTSINPSNNIPNFLLQCVRETAIAEAVDILCSSNNSESSFAVFKGEEEIVSVKLWDYHADYLELADIEVNENYYNRGLGGAALKCVLAIAFERNKAFLLISNVTRDGYSFWPRMGSLPAIGLEGARRLARDMSERLRFWHDCYSSNLSATARREIDGILRLSRKRPLWAWRLLSQSFARLETGELISRLFFSEYGMTFSVYDNLLVPGEKSTQMILQQRLGIIPVFSFSMGRLGSFKHIVREIVDMNSKPRVYDMLCLRAG